MRQPNIKLRCPHFVLGLLLAPLLAGAARAQTTSFTYQGRLTDGGNPASGNYDLQFALFDASSGGGQIGSTQTKNSVGVSAGIFTVALDFGVSAFPGANRFLEIGVRPAGGGSFTILSPRQQISSTPYAIRTLSATTADGLSSACVACVQDSQINQVAGSKISGTIPVAGVPTGSSNYIQNGTSQQPSANFNISGNGIIGGNVGIGTTPSLAKLEVQDTTVGGAVYGKSTTNNGIGVRGDSTNYYGVYGSSIGSNGFGVFGESFGSNGIGVRGVGNNGGIGVFGGSIGSYAGYFDSKVLITSNSSNASALVQTPAGSFAQYQLKSGATNSWTVGTQDNFANNALLFRNGSTDLMKINPDGNLSQPPATNGLVKATLLVNANGSINLCYNSQLTGSAATLPLCGFNVNHPATGVYDIQFPFQVNVRFFSLSPAVGTNFTVMGDVRPIFFDSVRVRLHLFTPAQNEDVDESFYLIVF